ncbi:glycosyltransferase family 4 protein [Microbacterium lushaniae]|nr:glycosyltransferase family 4 protein [Microbacterium lushaniae]KAA9153117.1 glycosyltransferase family 4 protein [Microbacterium lushaniae]
MVGTGTPMTFAARVKKAISSAMPDPIAERVLPFKRAAFREAGVTSVADAPCRLFLGPVNSAGQAHAWARVAESLPGVAAANFMYRNAGDVFRYPADHAVATSYFVTNRRWQRAQRRAVSSRFTHVLIESGREILGSGRSATEDAAFLAARGVTVGLLWHGSDIRTPSVHAATEPDSPFRRGDYVDQERLEQIARANHTLIRDSGLPCFVSTPDLLGFVPDAVWLPVVVEPARWASSAVRPPLTGTRRPVVVHAPSRAGLKGTALIQDAVRRLDAEGVIEYRELAGLPAARMPEAYGQADIVLDQFSLGMYGVAACEALAGGRLVISHVSDEVRGFVRRTTGLEPPIMQSRAADLEETLRHVVSEPDAALALAATGPGFVAAVHSGRLSAAALATFLGVDTNRPGRACETGGSAHRPTQEDASA